MSELGVSSYKTDVIEKPPVVREQLLLWTRKRPKVRVPQGLRCDGRRELLATLLKADLDFRGENTSYSRHNFHSFAAKFPPQLPKFFIENLSAKGELVLDPMMGSGTAVLEALLAERRAVGFDIDPLAVRLCQMKTLPLAAEELFAERRKVIERAHHMLEGPVSLDAELAANFDDATKAFVDYWFAPATQRELLALRRSIEAIDDPRLRVFFDLAFSAIIVTKSGGVSLAMDLAHSRPHKVRDKSPKNAVQEFEKRCRKNIAGLLENRLPDGAQVHQADARNLPLADNCVDLTVTSPPYANAIDYVRAHKFSLVWLGVPIESLTELRAEYIGAERAGNEAPTGCGRVSAEVLRELSVKDLKKARILSKYFREMRKVLSEMFRVTRPGRCAVLVVGSSTMRGIDVRTPDGLVEVAQSVGWDIVGVGSRRIDRDKRMMPMRASSVPQSGIEQRMSVESVIGLFKSL